MTIAIGLLASNGVVIAADSQLTIGDAKVRHGKIHSQTIATGYEGHPGGSCVVTGAGMPDTYLFECTAIFQRAFAAHMSPLSAELRAAMSAELVRFYDAHILPFAGLPLGERPDIDMLVGHERNGMGALWRSDETVLVDASPYAAVGIGAPPALAALARLYRHPFLDVWETVLLAAYVMHATQESNIYCGKHIDICVLTNNSTRHIPSDVTLRLERFRLRRSTIAAVAGIRRAFVGGEQL
jgi:ATP-dependent protease HslVU (ClpYQ) peptidase subunit